MYCTRLVGNGGRKKSPSRHHRTTLSDYIFATKACIDNRNKSVKQQCLPHMYSQYGELRTTSDWDLLASLRHPCKFQQVSRLGSITARHSSSGRQPNFAVLNRGRHLYSAGRPSRWVLAHISSVLSVHCTARGLRASFLYRCPASCSSSLRQHGLLVFQPNALPVTQPTVSNTERSSKY